MTRCVSFGNAPKKYASRYCQLKVGHRAVGTFLASIGLIKIQCWHQYTTLPQIEEQRRKLVSELEKEGITWQVQAEKIWLAGLLANKKAVAPLFNFLKATKFGGRKGAREKEAKWERKYDQGGADLLGQTQEGTTQKVTI